MKIVSTEINNILSIESAQLSFDNNGLVLVEGWNFDDGRANGAGKTAIFNAICFGLYGDVPRKINISDILRRGAKKGYVVVHVDINGTKYGIKRERPNKVTYYVNSVEQEMTQQQFETHIKLSYDQFLVSMYTAQNSSEKFIYKNDSKKKDFLLQLLNLNEFSLCKKEVDSLIKDIEKHITELSLKLNTAKSKIQAYEESHVDPTDLQDSNTALDYQIRTHIATIKTLEGVQKPEWSKYAALEQNILTKRAQFLDLRSKRTSLFNEFRSLTSQDKPFVEKAPDSHCPACDEALNINGKNLIKNSDLVAVKKQHEEHLNEIRSKATDIKKQIDSIDLELSKEAELDKLTSKLRDKKIDESAEYDSAIKKISELKSLIERLKVTIESNVKRIEEQNLIINKKNELLTLCKAIENQIDSKNQELEVLNAVSQLYSTTGAQAYIMDSVVDSFNQVVGKYVDMIWPNASYQLNSYKEKSDGDVVARFSETLVIGGKECSIGSMSGGEQRALSLAVDFAIVDVLSKQFGMPLNPIIMDEPFEGLDATGREVVIELLEKLAADRQIWVVDHASEAKAMFSKTMRVEKRNGISTIVV
jgi:DNA repair exonuclease SbcCD ATPase subunit